MVRLRCNYDKVKKLIGWQPEYSLRTPGVEREELIEQLKVELQWVKYRIRMLDIIEEKLLQMRKMTEIAKESNLSSELKP